MTLVTYVLFLFFICEETKANSTISRTMTTPNNIAISTIGANSSLNGTTKNGDKFTIEPIIAVICFLEVGLSVAVCFAWKAKRERNKFKRLGEVGDDNRHRPDVKPTSISFNRRSRVSFAQNVDLTNGVCHRTDNSTQTDEEANRLSQAECAAGSTVSSGEDYLKRKSSPSFRKWLLRSSSFRISQMFGRRASKSKYASGCYEEPWDETTFSENLRNPQSKFYVDNEDTEMQDDAESRPNSSEGETEICEKRISTLEPILETTRM